MKPILSWLGGKRNLLPEISKYYKNLTFNSYFEPFVGGASVFLDIEPSIATLSDFNEDLVNMYICIRDCPQELIEELMVVDKLFHSEGYYYLRDLFNSDISVVKKSACLIGLNKTCFNGVYRVNSSGKFNVPEGRNINPKIILVEKVLRLSRILSGKHLIFQDYSEIEVSVKPKDFIYFDPPYQPISKTSSFTNYIGVFDEACQLKLFELFKRLDNLGAYVLASNSFCNFITELYSGYNIETVHSSRALNSIGSRRGKVKEVLIAGKTLMKDRGDYFKMLKKRDLDNDMFSYL